ncbi:hypothetical protein FB451DRAFT_1495825 [Mycena latifolia]|nr:hypothetical protein FB451DRAFT_1495825 [Mycena latifolia]
MEMNGLCLSNHKARYQCLHTSDWIVGIPWFSQVRVMYPDPHAFKPERFLIDGMPNPAVRDPDAAFGFGRRYLWVIETSKKPELNDRHSCAGLGLKPKPDPFPTLGGAQGPVVTMERHLELHESFGRENGKSGRDILCKRISQVISSEGRHQKRKVAQAEHDRQMVGEHREKKTKAGLKKAAEIAEINKCVPVFDIARFTDPGMLKEILAPQLDLQLKWHRLREFEMDKKTEIPPLSRLKKQQKAELIVAAVVRWKCRVDAGEVPLMGFQSSEPVEEDRVIVEPDNEEDDADRPCRDLSECGKRERWICHRPVSNADEIRRSIYRTIELATGWDGRIIHTEVEFNVMDGGMVVLAIFATLNIAHPGLLLRPAPVTEKEVALESVDIRPGHSAVGTLGNLVYSESISIQLLWELRRTPSREVISLGLAAHGFRPIAPNKDLRDGSGRGEGWIMILLNRDLPRPFDSRIFTASHKIPAGTCSGGIHSSDPSIGITARNLQTGGSFSPCFDPHRLARCLAHQALAGLQTEIQMQALAIFFTHEPLLYRTLVIGGDALDEIPPCPVEAFTRIAGTESVSFLRDSVHNLHHTQHRRRAQQYLPHLDRSKAPVLFGPFESFSHPLFSYLTHLELFSGLTNDDDDLAARSSSTITGLSHLTHLSFDTTAILAICAHLLTGCRSLRALIILRPPPRYEVTELHTLPEDPRFVMMLLEHYIQDWQRGILTGNDYWSSADSFIEVGYPGQSIVVPSF